MKTIAIIGGNNVGKSTLFNKLTKSKLSITSSKARCTVDINEATLKIDNKFFKLVDTPSLALAKGNCTSQIADTLSKACIILFVVSPEVTLEDFNIKEYLHKNNKSSAEIILLVNKSEKIKSEQSDCYVLGISETIFISAKSGLGIKDLMSRISKTSSENPSTELPQDHMKIAIIGKPNVGKSTLINNLAGYDRVITSSIAGTTRDSVWINILHENQNIQLYDTAGIRKNSHSELERISIKIAYSAIEHADVTVLLISSENGITRQDLNIANFIIKKGKGLIIAVNKCDLLPEKNYKAHIEKVIRAHSFISQCPVLMLSALHDKKYAKLLNCCIDMYSIYSKKITTSALNKWMQILPSGDNHQTSNLIKLKYISQIGIKPLSFIIFVNKKPKNNYVRYFEKELKKFFDLSGAHIKTKFKVAKNKYQSLSKSS